MAKKFFYRSDCYTIRDVVDLVFVIQFYKENIPSDFWDLLFRKSSVLEHRWKIIQPKFNRNLDQITFDPTRIKVDSGLSEIIEKSFSHFLNELKTFNPESEDHLQKFLEP
jgi:hypothetical protein